MHVYSQKNWGVFEREMCFGNEVQRQVLLGKRKRTARVVGMNGDRRMRNVHGECFPKHPVFPSCELPQEFRRFLV